MIFLKRCFALLACWIFVAGLSIAAPVEIAGVKLQDTVKVANTTLQLNGMGIRYKAIFQVYVAALYTGRKTTTPEQFFAAPEAKRFHLTMLRDVDSNELGKAFIKGFQDNAQKADMGKLLPGLARMGQIFSDQKKLLAGDTITIDWVPGTGTVITIAGEVQGEAFKDVEFYNAMMRVWLGTNPADWKLKDSLLGKTSASS